MFTDHEILWDEHLTWWKKAAKDETKRILLYCEGDRPLGIVQFFDIHSDGTETSCHWGFYLDNYTLQTDILRLKTWLSLEKEAIDYAFNVLQSNYLICETFEFNASVIEVHKKFGFKETRRYTKEKSNKAEVVVEMIRACTQPETLSPQELTAYSSNASAENPLNLVFLGSANWDLVAQGFVQRYKLWTGKDAHVLPIPFGQYKSLLLDDQSILRSQKADIWIFCDRLEDFIPSSCKVLTSKSFQAIESAFDSYIALIKTARSLTDSQFYILDLISICPSITSLENSVYEPSSADAFVLNLNQQLHQLCQSLPNSSLIRLSSLVQQVGIQKSAPGKYWHIGRFPYHSALTQKLNDRLIATYLASQGKTARVIITDLDNTLWDGVIGDDGLSGIQLGEDYPGSVFSEIQATLCGLKERGIALAICSKNTESIALKAIQAHPGMRLKPEDFVAFRINWNDKAQNIVEIANEIGVGLSSILFLDDSPYEREAIRQQLPQVIVPELPKDITHWSSFLLNYPYLATLELTEEDKKRAERYQIRAQIQREMSVYTDKTEYWRSLEIKVTIHRLQSHYQKRVLQLLAKTNQFNTTAQRYTEIDLQHIVKNHGMIFPIGVADKYSEHEIAGLIILIPSREQESTLVIDSFLLSCRVLGRGIETALLAWICQKAVDLEFKFLQGNFVMSDRNLPAKEAYLNYGFHPLDSGNFQLDVQTQEPRIIDWLSIIEEL